MKTDPWQRTCTFSVRDRLSISDSSYFFDSPIIATTTPGTYHAEVHIKRADGHDFVARFRAQLDHHRTAKRSPLGKVIVDFGQILVCDRLEMESTFDLLGDEGMNIFYEQLNTTELAGTVGFDNGVTAPIFRPGFGDGSYEVVQLFDANLAPIGVEIDCEQHAEVDSLD